MDTCAVNNDDYFHRLGTRAVPGLPGAPYPPTLAPPWNIKPEPGEVDREREQREREQRERERERERVEREREREKERERSNKERERLRREEKQRRHIAHQQAAQQQQAAAAAAAAAQQQLSHVQHQHHAQSAQQMQQASGKSVIRDRSPLRDTPSAISQKEEELLMLGRGAPTYLRQAPRSLPPAPQFAHWEHYR